MNYIQFDIRIALCTLFAHTDQPQLIRSVAACCEWAVWWMLVEFAMRPADLAEAAAKQKL